MTEMTGGIVVGYDGSLGSEEALLWAIREAKARRTALTACLAWAPDYLAPQDENAARRRGEEILTWGLRYAQSQLGSANVRQMMVRGPAAHVLCEYSESGEMVVVGQRGHGGLTGQLLGSVPWQLASHAQSPVVIIRSRRQPVNNAPGPVVVGVDGSAASRAAILFAFEEAALRGVPLLAVCALMDAAGTFGGAGRLEEDFDHVMTAQGKEHPDVTVLRQIAPGSPCAALLTAAAEAQLLVLGAQGRGALASMCLGSVAYVVLLHAPCPVAVVHPSGGDQR